MHKKSDRERERERKRYICLSVPSHDTLDFLSRALSSLANIVYTERISLADKHLSFDAG